MLHEENILQIDDGYAVLESCSSKGLIFSERKYKRIGKFNLKNLERDKLFHDIRNMKLRMVLHSEEVYSKIIDIPRVKRGKINGILKNELKYYFDNIDSIMYFYSIIKSTKKKIKLNVTYFNTRKNDLIKKCSEIASINGIYLIQFCYLYYFKKYFMEINYLFVFLNKESLYLIAVNKGEIMLNSVVKNFTQEEDTCDLIKNFLYECKMKSVKDFNTAYILNLNSIGQLKKGIQNCRIINLGMVDSIEVVKSYM